MDRVETRGPVKPPLPDPFLSAPAAALSGLPRAALPSSADLVALFQAVQALRIDGAPFVLQFLAPHARAGTSFLARGFAQAAASATHGRVLLLDATMAPHPTATGHLVPLLGQAESPLLPSMFGPMEGCRNLYVARLAAHLSPAIALPPGELARCFAALRDRFESVIVDCSALSVVAQSAMLARYADGTALVVEQGTTQRAAVLSARRHVEAMGGQVIGAVFNRAGQMQPLPAVPRLLIHWMDRVTGRHRASHPHA